MKVELTKSQCMSLCDFIETYLLDAIRKDTEVDSLEWLLGILQAKMEFEKAVKEYERY
jgi:hypothetical protein